MTRIAISVTIDAGSLISVVNTNVTRLIAIVARPSARRLTRAPVSWRRWEADPSAGLGAELEVADRHEAEDRQRDGAADRGDRREVEERDHDAHRDSGDEEADGRTLADAAAHHRRELARRRQLIRHPGRRVQA